MNKRDLSETDICDRFITPALRQAGWLPERILREHSFPDGRIIVRGRLVSRGQRKRADYLLVHEGVPVEAASILIPTLAEQHRIVAKVDELRALCDQLEQQLHQADQQRRRLLEALLAESLREPEAALEGMPA
jgi:type I restriction enzyme R subunit